MTDTEYLTDAVKEYARNHGALNPDKAWIVTPLDTVERNPYYQGPPVPHPEDDDARRYIEEHGHDAWVEATKNPPEPRDWTEDEIPF